MTARPGRRPGKPDTRAAILAAAARQFAERGYDGATVRSIASDAEVDPALISHYFGSKEQLFLTCIDAPLDPRSIAQDVASGPPGELAARLLTGLLDVWDSPAGAAGLGLLRTAVRHEWSAKLLREFVLTRAVRPIVGRAEADPQRAAWRASLVASQVAGLLMVRYVFKVEPIASAPHEAIVAALAPGLQHLLTGDIAAPPA